MGDKKEHDPLKLVSEYMLDVDEDQLYNDIASALDFLPADVTQKILARLSERYNGHARWYPGRGNTKYGVPF